MNVVGLFFMTIGMCFFFDFLIDRTVRAFHCNPSRLGNWKAPFKCRALGHDWKETQYLAQMVLTLSPVEMCSRCRVGRAMGIFGFNYQPPGEIDRIVATNEGVKTGNIVKLPASRFQADHPRPLPPAG